MSWQWGVAFATNFTIFFVNLLVGLIINFDPWSMNQTTIPADWDT
jgi:hypothetical protein